MTRSRGTILTAVAALLALAVSCGGDEAATRRVLVDYSSDEFASFALFNYPAKVKVRQGDVLEFKQTWTGEPHTVTGGTTVDATLRDGAAWMDFFDGFEGLLSSGAELPNPDDPGDSTVGDLARAVATAEDEEAADQFVAGYEGLMAMGLALPPLDEASTQPFTELVELIDTKSEEFFAGLPSAFDDEDQLAQNVSQPCYLDEGTPPEDPETPCAKADQRQPAFTGRQSYYNSGVIPYEGERSNTFRVKIADDAEVGSFLFYCAIHGLGQRSEVEIVEAGTEVPGQSEINRQVRTETAEVTTSLGAIFRDAKDDLQVELPGFDEPVEGPFAGLPGADHTAINEFVPRVMTVKAGEPITWKMMGSDHTISFDVPKYFPIMEFLDDGTVRINPKMQPAAGDAVPFEPPDEEEGGGEGEEGGDGIVRHDGGTFDGDGFWSSGLIGAEPYLEYTMRISKPGTYAYACLLHPPMVGQIKVT
jgi:plastocyanin